MSEPETGRAFVPERERLAIEAEVRASLAAKVLDEARDVVRILSRYEHGRMIDGTEFVGVFEVRLGRLIEGSDPASPEQKDGDFESMLAGYDRIIHDKALQQELLDAGLLVKVDPATGEPIEGSDPARSEDRHDMIATLAVAAAAASSLPTHPTAAGRPPTGSWPDPTSPEAALDAAAVHRILCFALIEHEPGTRVPYLWPCTKFLAEYARLAESSRG